MLSDFYEALLFATIGGITIPLGALAARVERIRPRWLEAEFRHSVIAFGGGILLAAVALVLVPEGSRSLDVGPALAALMAGGLLFFWIDRLIARHGGGVSQLLAMLLDFVPEAMAMGALLTLEGGAGPLLALLIALQNFPEGFNAYREMIDRGRHSPRMILLVFSGLVLLGPLAAFFGQAYGTNLPELMGGIMLAAAGGILYLTFQEIAPQARLNRAWAPPLGAVAGFAVGLGGHMVLG